MDMVWLVKLHSKAREGWKNQTAWHLWSNIDWTDTRLYYRAGQTIFSKVKSETK